METREGLQAPVVRVRLERGLAEGLKARVAQARLERGIAEGLQDALELKGRTEREARLLFGLLQTVLGVEAAAVERLESLRVGTQEGASLVAAVDGYELAVREPVHREILQLVARCPGCAARVWGSDVLSLGDLPVDPQAVKPHPRLRCERCGRIGVGCERILGWARAPTLSDLDLVRLSRIHTPDSTYRPAGVSYLGTPYETGLVSLGGDDSFFRFVPLDLPGHLTHVTLRCASVLVQWYAVRGCAGTRGCAGHGWVRKSEPETECALCRGQEAGS